MRVQVVIATRNRPGRLAEALGSVTPQLRAGDAVLVVDQSDEVLADEVAAVCRVAGARCLRTGPTGLPAARNAGVRATDAPVLLFLDDDATLGPGALDAHRDAYVADLGLGGAVGWIDDPTDRPNATPGSLRIGLDGRVRYNPTGGSQRRVQALRGCNMSLRRVAVNAAGPCDTGLIGNAFLEDAEWAARISSLGWRLAYLPGARVLHRPAPDGGCRIASAFEHAQHRFRHTGRFLARHRGLSVPLALITFTGIAVRDALRAREPARAARLMGAMVVGLRASDAAAWPLWPVSSEASP